METVLKGVGRTLAAFVMTSYPNTSVVKEDRGHPPPFYIPFWKVTVFISIAVVLRGPHIKKSVELNISQISLNFFQRRKFGNCYLDQDLATKNYGANVTCYLFV